MTDSDYIKLAIEIAENGLGQTSPNPAVGAVLVDDNEQIISTGFHAKAGTPHAERVAISNAEKAGFTEWSSATIYVTLEPCSTIGKTGACSQAIIEKGIRRVVYGSVDPNPAHVGQADQILQSAGIEVSSRINEKECDHLIRGFRKAQTTGMPWVIIKSAMSLDGKITRPAGEGQWLTNPQSREQVHHLRAEVDAIITGGNTLRKDNPSLTVRLPHRSPDLRQPKRVVFTRDQSQLPEEAQIIRDSNTLIYETPDHEAISNSLSNLVSEHGINTVLIEAGGELLGQFVDVRLVDEVVMYYAPILTGGDKPAIAGQGAAKLSESLKLNQIQYQQIGNDVMMRGIVKK